MSDEGEVAVWALAYVDSRNQVAGMLMGIRRRSERAKACLKVLLDAAAALTARAPAAIGAPSAEHAMALAQIAGAAWAAREVIEHGRAGHLDGSDPRVAAWLARRSSPWGGQFAAALMAASHGEMSGLLHEGAVPELQAGVDAGRTVDADWLVHPAFRIDHAAAFLAELTAAARPRPAAVHEARAEALGRQIASAVSSPSAHISAHAFAVHHLTGIYGPGDDAVNTTMLRFVASHPPDEHATLQASKVAALLSDALGERARMALLDHIIVLLGPTDGDPSVRIRRARDSALVLLLLETVPPVTSGEAAADLGARGADWIAEIAGEAERAIVAAAAERQARYERAVDAGSLADALAIVRDAAVDDDHEQAWSLLQDIARRHPHADAGDLVTAAGAFDGPGAGCFTVLSPEPAAAAAAIARVAPRLLNVDDRGIEHPDRNAAETSGAYTPNYLDDVVWCDRGAQVTLDTKGSMPARMAGTMVAILTHALVEDRVPALVTGWIAALDGSMTRWEDDS